MILLSHQEYDPFFDDTSDWSDNNEISPQPTSSRFHKRGSAQAAFSDEPKQNSGPSRFRRRSDGASSQSTKTISDDFAQTKYDNDDFSGSLNDSQDFGEEQYETSSSSKSFAGFLILTALLVVAVCSTFLVKNHLSKNHGDLSGNTDHHSRCIRLSDAENRR